MAPFFFHVTHPTSAPLFQPWTTSTNTWKRLVRTSSFPRPSVLPLLSESKHLTTIMTKQTNQMSIGSHWVSLFIFLFIYALQEYSLQFSTLVINYNTSRKLDGRKAGLKPLTTLSVPNLMKLMHLWISKNSLTLLLLPVYVLFKLSLYLC